MKCGAMTLRPIVFPEVRILLLAFLQYCSLCPSALAVACKFAGRAKDFMGIRSFFLSFFLNDFIDGFSASTKRNRRNRMSPRWPVGVYSGRVLSRSDTVPGVFDSFLDSSYGIMLGARILHSPK